MDTEVYDHAGAILWLWKVHNSVNRRLHGAPSEDPESPKVQFPVKEMCPLCHGKVVFRESEILFYLTEFYGTNNIE